MHKTADNLKHLLSFGVWNHVHWSVNGEDRACWGCWRSIIFGSRGRKSDRRTDQSRDRSWVLRVETVKDREPWPLWPEDLDIGIRPRAEVTEIAGSTRITANSWGCVSLCEFNASPIVPFIFFFRWSEDSEFGAFLIFWSALGEDSRFRICLLIPAARIITISGILERWKSSQDQGAQWCTELLALSVHHGFEPKWCVRCGPFLGPYRMVRCSAEGRGYRLYGGADGFVYCNS